MIEKKKLLQINKPWKMGLSIAIGLSIFSFTPDLVEAEGKKWDFNYTGSQQTWVSPSSGKYLVEVWGAQGGSPLTSPGSSGGKGGYAKGELELTSGDTLYAYVGASGNSPGNPYTFNGGAKGYDSQSASGGGATDIRILSGAWNDSKSLYSRFIVAGGGGGSSQYNGYSTGGVGGGTIGGNFTGSAYSGYYESGRGGKETSVGTAYTQYMGADAGFGYGGYGGSGDTAGSGGGGGWYGGSHGVVQGGGGGSGYVLNAVSHKPGGYSVPSKYHLSNVSILSGNQSMPAPTGGAQVGHVGNGFARITQLVVPPTLTVSPETTEWTSQNVEFDVQMERGEHDLKEMFLPDGTKTTDKMRTYTVTSNGTYTFKAVDVMGNETVETVTVSNIDKSAPTATLNAASPSGNRVKLNLTSIVDTGGSGIKSILLPNGVLATGSTASYTVSKNGIYEFVVTDHAGNQTVKSIEVTTLNDSTIEWSFAYSGAIEEFAVPRSGKYKVETWGAEGSRGSSGYTAGKGAYAVSVLNLNENDWLKVLVGQQGLNLNSNGGSGGGGSFVAKADNTPISVAGGGGGSYSGNFTGNYHHGQPTRQVQPLSSFSQQQSEGQGGFAGYNGAPYPSTSGAGGGFYGDGMANNYSGGGSGGYAFVNGGGTGKGYTSGVHGGFGGGGGTAYVGGGGGGYTGGHAGTGHSTSYYTGGGGGSYFTGAEGFAKGGWETMPNLAGTGTQTGQSGNGAVKITRIVTPPEFSINVPTLNWTNEGFNATVNVSADGEYEYVKMILPNGTETISRNFTYPITANGTFKFTAVDANGYRHEKTLTITNIEKNAPTGSESVSTTGWTRTNVTLTATGSDTGGSGLKAITLVGDPTGENSNPLVNGNRKTFSISQNGTYTVVYEDNAGNKTQKNITVSNIDKEGAIASFSPNETVGWVKTGQTIRIDPLDVGTSGISYFRYRTSTNNGASWSGWNGNYSSWINVGFGQGENLIEVELYDRAGNVSTVRSGLYQIDTTLSNGSLNPSTTNWTNGDVTLNLTGVTDTGGSGLRHIELPNGQIVSGTSASYIVSENGTYTFKLVDNAGNERILSRTVSNIDKTIPSGTLSLSNPNLTNGAIYIYARGSDSQSGFSRIKNPDGSFTYSTASNFYISQNGSYSFEFYDNAGNVTTETIEVNTIDRVAPTYSFTPNGTPTSNGTPYINEDVTVEIKVDDEGVAGINYWQYQIYDSNYGYRAWVNKGNEPNETITFNQSGYYFIRIQAYDKAGNNIGTPSSQYYYVDKTKPTASQSYSTTSHTNGNVTLYLNNIADNYSGIDKITRPDGSVISATSSTNYTVTENGEYVFKVSDRSGNEEVFTYIVENIDKTPPTFNLSKNGGAWDNTPHSTTILPQDNLSGVNVIQYAWSNSSTSQPTSWTNYSLGANIIQPTEGIYYLWVRLYDRVGNVTVERSAPYRFETNMPSGSSQLNKTTWSNEDIDITIVGISDTGGSGYLRTKLPNGVYSNEVQPSYKVSENGVYRFEIEDNAGNIRVVNVTVSNIDKKQPVALFEEYVDVWTNQNVTLHVNGALDEDSGIKHIELPDGQIVVSSTADYSVPQNGSYTFRVVDKAGNVITKTYEIQKIDKVPPNGNIQSDVKEFTSGNVTLWLENVNDDASGVKQVILPDGTISSDLNKRYEADGNGKHVFTILDRAGNRKDIEYQVNNIDREKPSAELIGNPSDQDYRLLLQNINDGSGSGIDYIMLPDGQIVSNKTSVEYIVTKNGLYRFKVVDRMGNESWFTHHVNNLEQNLNLGEYLASGIEFAEYQMNGATSRDWTPLDIEEVTSTGGIDFDFTDEGVTHFVINARDYAGNRDMKMRVVVVEDGKETVSPLKNIRYKLTGATQSEWQEYSQPFYIQNEGITTVHVVAEDEAGNQLTFNRQVKIDKSEPINNAVEIRLD